MDPKGNNLNQELFCRGLKSNSQTCDSCHYRQARKPSATHQCSRGSIINYVINLACWLSQAGQGPSTISRLVKDSHENYIQDHKEITSSQMVGSQAHTGRHIPSISTSGNMFHIASVAMLTCGVDRDGLIRVSKAPTKNSKNEIQAMKNCGCYLEQQLIIESGWNYHKVTSQLQSWFPKVFDYLNVQAEKQQSATLQHEHEKKPIWQLLNKCRQTLTVIDIGFLARCDLVKHKGQDKANNSVNIKSDNDIASSLMELDMSLDSDTKDPKGKGKAAPAKSPMRRQNVTLRPPPLSSEATRKAVQKKLKKEPASGTAVPLFLMNSESASELEPPPSTQIRAQSNSYTTLKVKNKISAPPDFVSVSKADVLWYDKIQDNDPFTEYINPWDSHYSMLNLANL
ncbi:uncharacterized protein BJ212DRAFT_1523754 [Suillus subaureus]|uniref:Uncharacterized protein n=1 Tax=Suillus subaureus TaxID=48587 RepID=A0A9P7JIT9_9AGAM|nr:uncharacterized protein BJ212DRAFT_1523754 [Suillus subaureus]KAG1824579.1 hypothetical protein BJ212DRAFT_1523754 [Suillus subaureus]